MVAGLVNYFSESTNHKTKKINIIPGWVEPSDMREIKRIASILGVQHIMFPDTSDVLDAPLTGKHEFYPKGGVTVEQLRDTGDSRGTVAMGLTASAPAAKALDRKCKVPCECIGLPIGLRGTDNFIETMRRMAKVDVPDTLTDERGRLLDIMSDMSQYLFNKRVALWGDPDQVLALCEFFVDLNMKPVYAVTGTPGKKFEKRMAEILGDAVPEAKYAQGGAADMFLMHQWIKEEPVDLLIGNTYGKYISRDEDIPFIRHGFPILDRVGHSYFPTVGYRGAMRLLEKVLDAFLDRQDRLAPEESFELVM